MKIPLAYPQHPETFWSFKHVLRFLGKRSALPPLGLVTVAAMLHRAPAEVPRRHGARDHGPPLPRGGDEAPSP